MTPATSAPSGTVIGHEITHGFDGQEPSQLVVPVTFTRLGAVLDLSLLVPAYLLAAVWLWRRRASGYCSPPPWC